MICVSKGGVPPFENPPWRINLGRRDGSATPAGINAGAGSGIPDGSGSEMDQQPRRGSTPGQPRAGSKDAGSGSGSDEAGSGAQGRCMVILRPRTATRCGAAVMHSLGLDRDQDGIGIPDFNITLPPLDT